MSWTSFAQHVETLGYRGLVMADHVVGSGFAPFPAFAAAAVATTTLRVGTLVLNNDFRNPLMLAREAATLDVISNGRLDFGIGAGWQRRDYDSLGTNYDAPGSRIARLREAVQLIKRFWGEKEVTHAGAFYRYGKAHSAPRPVQRPHPPVLIGGGGDRILELAMAEADTISVVPQKNPDGTVNLMGYSWESAAERFDYVRRLRGDRDVELGTCIFGLTVTDDRASGIRELVAKIPGAELAVIDRSPFYLVGTLAEIRTQLLRIRDTFDVNQFSVRGKDIELFAPLATELGPVAPAELAVPQVSSLPK